MGDIFDGEALAAYMESLFPTQQQAIATAQLAGCRFEKRVCERDTGRFVRLTGSGSKTSISRWIETTEYEVFLPDGTSAGTGEDIYECALIALRVINTPLKVALEENPLDLFRLDPENEPT